MEPIDLGDVPAQESGFYECAPVDIEDARMEVQLAPVDVQLAQMDLGHARIREIFFSL